MEERAALDRSRRGAPPRVPPPIEPAHRSFLEECPVLAAIGGTPLVRIELPHLRKPEVEELYEQTVKDLTGHLAQYERIKKLALLPSEFTLEAGELTPTLKVKRRVVEQKYKDVIDRMYEGAAA